MPSTTGDHTFSYPSEGATGWYATWETMAQAITNHMDNLADVQIDTIEDSADNELLKFSTTASAVNYVNITNAATTGGPIIAAAGDDANIDLVVNPKGTGQINLDGVKWPASDGSASQFLQTDGAGNTSWAGTDVVSDTSPQLGGMLDVNGNAIGDGTRELITFTEDGSAVNHVNIENQATAGGPIISAAGDDANIDLNLQGKGTGKVVIDELQLTTNLDVTEIDINGATALTSVADADEIIIYDADAGSNKKITKANLVGAGGGIWTAESDSRASAATSVELTLSTADLYRITFKNLDPSTDPINLLFTVSSDGGSSYKSSLYQHCRLTQDSNTTTPAGAGSNSDSSITLVDSAGTSASNEGIQGVITLYEPSDASNPMMIMWDIVFENESSGYLENVRGAAQWNGADAINSVKIAFSGGTITGDFRLESREV